MNSRLAFQEELRSRASRKRTAAKLARTKAKAPAKKDVLPTTAAAKLDEILGILRTAEPKNPVRFVVTERDGNGKIKSFKVDRA